jgi:hypothetical protein
MIALVTFYSALDAREAVSFRLYSISASALVHRRSAIDQFGLLTSHITRSAIAIAPCLFSINPPSLVFPMDGRTTETLALPYDSRSGSLLLNRPDVSPLLVLFSRVSPISRSSFARMASGTPASSTSPSFAWLNQCLARYPCHASIPLQHRGQTRPLPTDDWYSANRGSHHHVQSSRCRPRRQDPYVFCRFPSNQIDANSYAIS